MTHNWFSSAVFFPLMLFHYLTLQSKSRVDIQRAEYMRMWRMAEAKVNGGTAGGGGGGRSVGGGGGGSRDSTKPVSSASTADASTSTSSSVSSSGAPVGGVQLQQQQQQRRRGSTGRTGLSSHLAGASTGAGTGSPYQPFTKPAVSPYATSMTSPSESGSSSSPASLFSSGGRVKPPSSSSSQSMGARGPVRSGGLAAGRSGRTGKIG